MNTNVSEAIDRIKSNDNVFIHSAAAAPSFLIEELSSRKGSLKNVSLYGLHTEGSAPYASEDAQDSFRIKSFFVGGNIRSAIQDGRGSYIPVFLSEIPALFRNGVIPLDVALISVSPPDKHGYCSLGPSVDISRAAVDVAKIVIAQVNKFMPRTQGDGIIHQSKITCMVEKDRALFESVCPKPNVEEMKIGEHISSLIENGSTLQMGIGSIPNAVLSCLVNHKNLGIHTEMFSDGILPLVESGVINGRNKTKNKGIVISSFVMGSRKIFDYIDDNPAVKLLDSAYVNHTDVIRKNPKMVAINSAIEIDLTGQVCADSIGSKIFSGVGGQMDFIRGASLSEGGKPIIALSSTTGKGISKIVSTLKPGAGVVTTRAHVHYVVTEYGAVNLYGKTIEERAKLLISIAHPNSREKLLEESTKLKFVGGK